MLNPMNQRSFRAPEVGQELANITDMAKNSQVRLRVAQHLNRINDGVEPPQGKVPGGSEKSSYGST